MSEEVNPEPASPPQPNRSYPVLRWTAHALAHALLGTITATALGSAVLAWNLARGPVDAAPVIPVLEKLMGDPARLRFDIGALTLQWRGKSDPLAFRMDDVHLLGPQGEFMSIPQIDLGLSVWRLFAGRLHFNYAKAQTLSVKLTRLEDGAITLTGLEDDRQSTAQSVALEMGNIVNDLPSIEHLTLTDTKVIFEDRKEAVIRRFDDVDLEMDQERSFGKRSVSGYLTTALTGFNDGSLATIDFIFDGEDKTLSTSLSLDRADTRKLLGHILREAGLPMIDMVVDGRAEVRLKNDFSLDFLKLRLKGDDGTLIWPRHYGEGLENQKLTNFDLDVGFDPKTQMLTLTNAEITIKGITLKTGGELTAKNGWDKLTGMLHAAIPVVAVDALPAVWPKIWDIGARHWLVDRMKKGRFADIAVEVPFSATRKPAEKQTGEEEAYTWDVQTGTIKSTFNFTGVNVDYRAPMLPAKGTTGTGSFEGMALTLNFTKARIGDLDVKKGRLFFDDLITPGTGRADLDLTIHGPVAGLFAYLEKEPIAYKRKVGIDGSAAKGTADVEVSTTFPTTKDMRVEDVKVKAAAKLHDLVMPGAVKGMTLAGKDFDLDASENHFKIEGAGTLDGQNATLSWHELFEAKPSDAFASKLEAKISTDKAIRQRFIGSLEDRVDGTVPITASMLTKPDGQGTVRVTADLTGARVDFSDPFNAVKEKNIKASATVTGTLDKGYIQSLDTLKITGNGINLDQGKITFTRDADNQPILAAASLKGLTIGQTDADIEANWKSETDLSATITGSSFDARGVLKKSEKTGNKPPAYAVAIKTGKLWVGDDLPLESVTAAFTGNADGTIAKADLKATAAGAPVTLHYGPDGLLWQSSNAGAALAACGVSDRVRGGRLTVSANPSAKTPGTMTGKMILEDFSVVKAPALAKLINLLSLPGLLSILSQDTGLKFARAESDITWLNRPGASVIQFRDGSTSGSSLGLTFEGEINITDDTVAMQGTAVPMSEINGLLSNIPLVGSILTGGNKGSGIFAATYTMKGPAADPDMTVNPLSVLTPGILRRILFEGVAPETSDRTKPKTRTGTKSNLRQ